jgi:ring-1,2-phenylacetyl-CoA epoxidase subunit PaaC
MSTTIVAPADVAEYALRLGDDALILAQRLGEWASRAPEIEEDLALTNIALDLLGQARGLLTRAGELEGCNRSEDELAYLRPEREFTNVLLVEQPNGDFAMTIVRQLLFATYQLALYERLQHSVDVTIAGVAAKAVKEVAYHRDHAVQWTLRLGDGTVESHRRMRAALVRLWPYVPELFETDALIERLAAARIAVAPADLRPQWETSVRSVLAQATLDVPATTWQPSGGRRGRHTEPFGYLLAELQSLRRTYPEVTW